MTSTSSSASPTIAKSMMSARSNIPHAAAVAPETRGPTVGRLVSTYSLRGTARCRTRRTSPQRSAASATGAPPSGPQAAGRSSLRTSFAEAWPTALKGAGALTVIVLGDRVDLAAEDEAAELEVDIDRSPGADHPVHRMLWCKPGRLGSGGWQTNVQPGHLLSRRESIRCLEF